MHLVIEPKPVAAVSTSNQNFHGSFEPSAPLESQSTSTPVEIVIPDSFLRGIADCDAGRVVDMELAMEQQPPPQQQ